MHPSPRSTGSLWRGLFALLLLLSASAVQGAGFVAGERAFRSLAGHLAIFRDPGGQMGLTEVREAGFTPLPGGLSAGYTRDAIWLRFELARTAEMEEEWWLIAQPPYLDDLRLYVPEPEGGYSERRAGDHVPVADRETGFREMVFKLELDELPRTYYLRVQSSSAMTMTLSLAPPDLYGERASLENAFLGLFFGMILIAAVISALSAFWLRETFYFVATGYLLSFAALRFTLVGLDQLFIYPGNPAVADNVLGAALCLLTVFYIWFLLSYVEPQRQFPRISRFLGWLTWGAFAATLFSAAGYYHVIVGPLAKFHALLLPGLLLLAVAMLRAAPQRALLYLLIFGPGTLAAIGQLLRNLGYLPVNFFTTYLWEVAVVIQLPLTALAVLIRVWETQQAHLAAKSLALEAAHRLENELEREVTARTTELAASNAALVERERDLIDAKAHAEELLAIEQARQQAQKSFIRMVAHELRTPLSIIAVGVTNLRTQTDTRLPELAPRYRRIQGAISRLNALVDNALAEDRLAAAEFDIHPEPLRPSELVTQIRAQLVLTEQHPLQINLPGDDSPILVDPCWFTLAVLNLIDNAVKYSPEGGAIVLDIVRIGEGLDVRVADSGIGIAAEVLPTLFDKFYRAPQAIATGVSGLGLGLYLVQRIAALHGGTVSVESEPGQGSRFTIHLTSHRLAT